MRVLVVNAGSSTLKLALLEGDEAVARRELETPRSATAEEAVATGLAELGRPDAVGHRVVHGGERFREPALVTPEVRAELGALTDLAPLHQPKSLAALDLVSGALAGVPAVACFDTAFHATIPAAAATYALPEDWRERWGLRRFGFHGLSHAYAARRAAELAGGELSELRIVTCHLGAGASLTAVRDGRSVDTTMGFTPLEGLVMATRSGSVDPGLLLWLAERGLAPEELADALEHRSGLLGLAGSADMREVLAGARDGDERAALALAVYVHRLRAGVAAMAAAAGGLDVLAFTGGVGERSPEVRSAAAGGLGFLGVGLDARANEQGDGDRDIAPEGAPVRTVVVHAREDLEIARGVRTLLAR